ncbi:DHA2 family efflux MFS transporter permease subunit [Crossiella sp. SN42]|uniref:DHA2 family efflux MFS transporter permease subunit n=1 Tax=Crossiella sp. SN42 TaxID=2944808 RepID=UPI00207D70D1|nr:DHA2 family efflux MFS transporter permease subunit [Crossiella sp. SN42]MCO1582538.1 DHA2 family efflux MFS transporter permease subunit [Crossiella sp. SN42]
MRTDKLILLLACACAFMVIMDATIVSVALPDIGGALGFPAESLPWVVNAYTLAFAGFLLLGGRCADTFGQRRILLLSLGLFTLARTLGGLATGPGLLLAARAAQGLGGALLMPVTLSLLTTTFTDPDRRTRALATWSSVGAVGAASGPVVGGLLTEALSWRWVFFVTVPIGVAAMVLAARILPPRDRADSPARLDTVGAVLATAGLVGVVYAVMGSAQAGLASPSVFGPLLGGVLLLAVFLVHQARWAADPLVPLGVFRLGSVAAANGVMFLLGLGFFASPVLVSLYLQYVSGATPMEAGLGYLPIGVAMYLGARAAGWLTVRWGARRATVLCCLVGAAGFLATGALLGVDQPYLIAVAVPGAVLGLGSAAAFTPITVAATAGLPPHHNGLAAGLLNAIRQTSGAIGLAVLSTVSATVSGGQATRPALAAGYSAAFLLSAAFLVAAAGLAAFALRTRDACTVYTWGRRTGSRQRR